MQLRQSEGSRPEEAREKGRQYSWVKALIRSEYAAPVAIVLAAVAISILFVVLDRSHERELTARAQAEAKLRLESYKASLEGLVQSGLASLRLVDLFESSETPGEIFNHVDARLGAIHWQDFPLSEIHIVFQRDSVSPLQTVTLKWDSLGFCTAVNDSRNTGDELRLHQALIDQYRDSGNAVPKLNYVSHAAKDGQSTDTGFLLSLPLRDATGTTGLITGFLSAEELSAFLERGNYHEMLALVGQNGEVIGCKDLPASTHDWLHRSVPSTLFRQPQIDLPTDTALSRWTTLWRSADLPGPEQWTLVYQYDKDRAAHRSGAADMVIGVTGAAGLLAFGFIIAVMVFRLRGRNRQLGRLVADIRSRRRPLYRWLACIAPRPSVTEEARWTRSA